LPLQKVRFLYFSYLGNGFFFFLIRAEDFIPAVLGGNDTSSIYFSSGMDAAGLNRSDVSASAETRHQKCTQMYTFDDAQQRSRCPPLVSAVEKTIRKPFENSGAGYKALNKQHPQAR